MGTTKVLLNTREAYNNGFTGYGWMDVTEAMEFIEENPEKDEGEWFIQYIDGCIGIDFGNLNHYNASNLLRAIEVLEDLSYCERIETIAVMEYLNTDDVLKAIERKKNYCFYGDIEEYYNFMDELVEQEMENIGQNSLLARYFDYEEYI